MQGRVGWLAVSMVVAVVLAGCGGEVPAEVDASEPDGTVEPADEGAPDTDPDTEVATGAPDATAEPDTGEDPTGDDLPAVGDVDAWTAERIGSCTDLPGFVPQDGSALTDAMLDGLRDPGGVRRADADLGPLTKAVLVLEATEAPLPRVRYRLRYGTELREAPPAADPVEVSFVQIDRFNLGPAIRAEAVDEFGEAVVGDPETFGVGPHVSYCLLMQPVMGLTADIVEVSRAEIPDAAADGIACLGGVACTRVAGDLDDVADWEDTGEVGFALDAVYETVRDGAPTAAAAIDLALVASGVAQADDGVVTWIGFEAREGLDAGQPFVDVVVEVGLGQDAGVDAVVREGAVMDDAIAVAWERIRGFPSAPDAPPFVIGARAVEFREGRS